MIQADRFMDFKTALCPRVTELSPVNTRFNLDLPRITLMIRVCKCI
jgi:hypothetical protein